MDEQFQNGDSDKTKRSGEEYKKLNIADGYLFLSEADALLAAQEEKKVAYLSEHLNLNNPAAVRKVYSKAIETRTFRTPIGILFVHDLREKLLENGVSEDELEPIPLFHAFGDTVREKTEPAKKRIQPKKKKEKVDLSVLSVMLNIVLVLMVIFMFWIAYESDRPNIINYRHAIENEYASWKQELTQREREIRIKERELNIESPIYDRSETESE